MFDYIIIGAGLVKKGIHLVGSGSNQPKPSCLEGSSERFNVVDPKLDLDFAVRGHAASIKKEGQR